MQTTCILSFGSNLGDRRYHLVNGILRLQTSGLVRLEAISRVVESQAWGPVQQGPYLNLLLRGEAQIDAIGLLELLQRIERDEGRVRDLRYGPRTLDIDIIFYGDLHLSTDSLTLPHPYWRERPFVHDLLGDVLPADPHGIGSIPGVQEALHTGGRLSPELREVEPISPVDLRLAEERDP